jgi:hypothetical protein
LPQQTLPFLSFLAEKQAPRMGKALNTRSLYNPASLFYRNDR